MGVAAHLGIRLGEYDARIRTFIPDYEEMLDVASVAVPVSARTIVDLGTGTGALGARCLERAPRARLIGIDVDADMLAAAARRLGPRATLVPQSFLGAAIPSCDVVAASFALHHIRTHELKKSLHRRVRASLGPRGRYITVDCHPALQPALARAQRAAWEAHLRRSYSPTRARHLLASWAGEDVYVALEIEVGLMRKAGFAVEVLWRKGAFAVLLGHA
jgi:trans-aconitate methyltransferase